MKNGHTLDMSGRQSKVSSRSITRRFLALERDLAAMKKQSLQAVWSVKKKEKMKKKIDEHIDIIDSILDYLNPQNP